MDDPTHEVSADESDESIPVDAPFTGERIGDAPACAPSVRVALLAPPRWVPTKWHARAMTGVVRLLERIEDGR